VNLPAQTSVATAEQAAEQISAAAVAALRSVFTEGKSLSGQRSISAGGNFSPGPVPGSADRLAAAGGRQLAVSVSEVRLDCVDGHVHLDGDFSAAQQTRCVS
jgi:hypothetical protein